MANNCVITFDQNEYGTYFTGQRLTGKVIITLNKPKKFKGIKLQINGYAQCQWRQGHGRRNHKPIYKANLKHKKRIFHGHEDYIASTTFLVGSEACDNFTIDSGTHTYTFACHIPINCPSSYEGAYGHIRYMVKVTFIRAGASNRTYNKGFTVLKMLDLNRESVLLRSPACHESIENLCFFNSKAVHLRADVTQTGYVPGQMISISFHVNNESRADVRKILITLNLRATYISETPFMRTISEKLCLVKKYCGPVTRHTAKNFAEVIRVPATPPTCDHMSKVVRLSYEICVKAIMNHLMKNPKTIIPITIGNIPLVSPAVENLTSIDDVPSTSASVTQHAADAARNLLSEEAEIDYELPPPTYEEAMFMTTNIGDDDVNTVIEDVLFTPRYPVYNVDNIDMSSVMTQGPPPNPPQKRRKLKEKKKPTQTEISKIEERQPTESPREI